MIEPEEERSIVDSAGDFWRHIPILVQQDVPLFDSFRNEYQHFDSKGTRKHSAICLCRSMYQEGPGSGSIKRKRDDEINIDDC